MPGILRRLRRRLGAIRRNLRHLGNLSSLNARIADLEARTGQLETVVKESGGVLPPPRHLQIRVAGVYAPDFLDSGVGIVGDLEKLVQVGGMELRSLHRILDFGCGCGRVLRPLRRHVTDNTSLFGTDIDDEAIAWCRENYSTVADFRVNGSLPPTPYEDGFFDFVYSISILTHLPEEMQFAWLHELRRIVRPGGLLMLSVHGPSHFDHIPKPQRESMSRKGFAYVDTGGTDGLPSFYQTAFHREDYIRSAWSPYVDVLDVRPLAVAGYQDAVVCRRPRLEGETPPESRTPP